MEPAVSSILSSFLQAFLALAIPILASALVGYLVVLVRRVAQLAHEKLPAEQIAFIQLWAGILVRAAEQEGVKNELLQYGAAKKDYVLTELQRILSERKITVDVATLSALIESSVYSELTRQQLIFASPIELPVPDEQSA